MGLLGSFTGLAVDIVLLPVAVVEDAGAIITGERPELTAAVARDIVDNITGR